MTDLRELGLSSYEDRAYRALLELGTATAREVAQASGVPMGRIYDALGRLEARDLIRSQTGNRPRRYVAVEPSIAVDRLLDDRKREIRSELDRLDRLAEAAVEGLERPGPVEGRFYTVAVGPNESVSLLLERLDAADEQIVVTAAEPTGQFDLDDVGGRVLDRLAGALDRGVAVSLLLDRRLVETAPDRLINAINREPFIDDAFSIRVTDAIHGTFNLIDENEVCIEIANPLWTNDIVGLIDLHDPRLAIEFENGFRERWDEAVEL